VCSVVNLFPIPPQKQGGFMGKKRKIRHDRTTTLVLGRKNWITFGTGILSILIGYIFLSRGSITAAPILLVLGYVILIPISLILR